MSNLFFGAGPIPESLGALRNLQELVLSGNQLSGEKINGTGIVFLQRKLDVASIRYGTSYRKCC